MPQLGAGLTPKTSSLVQGQLESITKQEQQLGERYGELSGRMEKTAEEREKTLAPMEAELKTQIAEPYPTRPKTELPQFKPQPIIDSKDYEALSYGLLAMAMVGGVASQGRWLEVGSSLNGALEGYLKGNIQNAQKRYDDYEQQFRGAVAKENQANKEFEDILTNKKLRLADQMNLYKIAAAKYDRQDALAAAQAKNYDAMWRSLESNKTGLIRIQEHNETVRATLASKMGTTGLSEKYNTDEAYRKQVDFWAKYVAQGNSLPPRFAQSGAGKQMFQDIVQITPSVAGSPESVRAGAVTLAGEKAQARSIGTRSATVEMAAGEARNMAQLVLDASAKFPRTSFMPINQALMAYQKNTGSVEARRFGATVNSYVNAYSRAISPTGTATVSDKDHAREILSTADSHEQLKGLMDILDQEMQAAQKAPRDVKAGLVQSITGGQPPAPKTQGSLTNARGWTLHTDAQGNKAYVSPDGTQFEEIK